MKWRNRRKSGGFTLVEVIAVMVILSILASAVIPLYHGYIEKAKVATYIAESRAVLGAARIYIVEEYAAGTLSREGVRDDLMRPEFGSPEHALTEFLGDNCTPGANISYLNISFETGEYLGMIYEIEGYRLEFLPGKEVLVTEK